MDSIRAVLAAILHLTNIKFIEAEGSTDAVEVENEDTMNKGSDLEMGYDVRQYHHYHLYIINNSSPLTFQITVIR